MPFIPAPGVAQVKLSGTTGSRPWNVIIHYLGGNGSGSWTQGQLNEVCNAIQQGLVNAWANYMPIASVFETVTAIDISTSTPQTGNSTHASYAGASGGVNDASASVLVNYNINFRRRGGRPRSYFPAFAQQHMASMQTWSPDAINFWQTSWTATLAQAATAAVTNGQASCSQVCPIWNYLYTDVPAKHKWTHTKQSWLTNAVVTGVLFSNLVASQRRRSGF